MRPQELRHRTDDGQALMIQAAPDDAGYPVLVHPGSPGSRHLFDPTMEHAARHGLRLISWDRPGYDETPGRPGRTIADGANEARAVGDALGLRRFATFGFSGGGAFALACAALLPDRISAAVAMAALAPADADGLDWAAGWSVEMQAEIRLYAEDYDTARALFRADADRQRVILSTAAGWLERWGDRAGADDAHSSAVADYLALVFRESLRESDEGWWEDWGAQLSPWGFSVADIRVPVQLWHGAKDKAVPVEHGQWLANRIPGVDAHFPDDADHTNIEADHQCDAWQWLARFT